MTKETEILPNIIPLLPLQGAVLLPHAQLPVPLTDREYNSIVVPAIQKYGCIGIVQPLPTTDLENTDTPPPLFKIGCIGRLNDIKEVEEDQRILSVFTGLCRFEIVEELSCDEDYRKAFVTYNRYNGDLENLEIFDLDRDRLLKALQSYFKALDINLNWQEIFQASDQKLITALAMVCPLAARERQALLELPSLKEQSQMITLLMEFGAHDRPYSTFTCH